MHNSGDSKASLEVVLPDAQATELLGIHLAKALGAVRVVYLNGDLGAGKTSLVRGVLRGMGHSGAVKSPTYTLIEPHVVSTIKLYHFDFYRFNVPEEFVEAGLDEYFCVAEGSCWVEWPDKAFPYLPAADLEIELDIVNHGRIAHLIGLTQAGQLCVEKLAKQRL